MRGTGTVGSPALRAGTLLLLLVALVSLTACQEVKSRRMIQRGNTAYYDGRYTQAILLYEEALAQEPHLAIGWYNLGLSYLAVYSPGSKTPENDKYAERAIDAFDKYMTAFPEDIIARDLMVDTYINSGRHEGAIEYFKRELARKPGSVEVLGQLAKVASLAGDYDEALSWNLQRVEFETTDDAKADVFFAIGGMTWNRLYTRPDIAGLARAKLADQGLGALVRAARLRPTHQDTFTFLNLLYRERAKSTLNSLIGAADLASAELYRKKATAMAGDPRKTPSPQPPAAKPGEHREGN